MDWDDTFQAFDAPVGPTESSFSLGIGFPDPVMGVEHPEMKSCKGRSDLENKTKKRLSNNQLEMLEVSFQEGIKLDPGRKIRLSTELGLEPRQVAVWFLNRRARWKAKQMEVLYSELRQEFDVACKEKLKLQEEELRLKFILRFRAAGKKQLALGSPGEQTGGSSSTMLIHSSMNEVGFHDRHNIDASTGHFRSDEHDAVTHPFYHSNTS